MKPVLLMLSTSLTPVDSTANVWIYPVQRMLYWMGIPHETSVTGGAIDKLTDAEIADRYSVVIIPWASTAAEDCARYLKGTLGIPVVAQASADNALNHAGNGVTTGSPSRIFGGTNAYFTATHIDGVDFTYLDSAGGTGYTRYVYNLDASCTSIMTRGDGKSLAWRRGNLTIIAHANPLLTVVEALKATGAAPRPYTLIVDIDDITTASGSAQNLALYAQEVRSRGGIIVGGLSSQVSDTEIDPALLSCLNANADVIKLLVHNHNADTAGLEGQWADNTAYPSVASKLAKQAERVAHWRSLGVTLGDSGIENYLYIPKNSATFTGYCAIAKMLGGFGLLRSSAGMPIFGDSSQIFSYDEGSNKYTLMAIKSFVMMGSATSTEALAQTDNAATGNADLYKFYTQWYRWQKILSEHRLTLWCHGTNLTNEAPALTWIREFSKLIDISGGWLGFADTNDIGNIHS